MKRIMSLLQILAMPEEAYLAAGGHLYREPSKRPRSIAFSAVKGASSMARRTCMHACMPLQLCMPREVVPQGTAWYDLSEQTLQPTPSLLHPLPLHACFEIVL